MKRKIIISILAIQGFLLIIPLSSFYMPANSEGYSLRVEVKNLRNSKGTVLFALYNRTDAFPDEHYEKYYRKLCGEIIEGSSSVIFEDLPEGKYAVNILHDEDSDGRIKKGIVLPKEGIGFSNYQSIGLFNRPTFNKASFQLQGDKEIVVNILYL